MIWINFNCQWTPMIDYQPLKKPTQTMIKSAQTKSPNQQYKLIQVN
jgi:hypothetical protein